jgi:hypothetical protein
MAVTVAAIEQPLSDQARAKMTPLAPGPSPAAPVSPYEPGENDAAPFDSAPGIGFDSDRTAAAVVPPPGAIGGRGPALALDPVQNNTFAALNRAWALGGRVFASEPGGASERGTDSANATSAKYIVTGLTTAQQDEIVKALALQASRVASPGSGAAEIKRPRVGLYRPWMASMDEGWTRWVLERYGFEIVSLTPNDFRAEPVLADRIDALIIADEARGLMDGYATGVVPAEYQGGIGADGVRAIDRFVRAGGTLVCFNRSTAFAIEHFALPVRNVVAGR